MPESSLARLTMPSNLGCPVVRFCSSCHSRSTGSSALAYGGILEDDAAAMADAEVEAPGMVLTFEGIIIG